MVIIVETGLGRFPSFLKLLVSHQKEWNSSNHDKAHMCNSSCPSVYPVVGVRQGATGPGRRPRATPV